MFCCCSVICWCIYLIYRVHCSELDQRELHHRTPTSTPATAHYLWAVVYVLPQTNLRLVQHRAQGCQHLSDLWPTGLHSGSLLSKWQLHGRSHGRFFFAVLLLWFIPFRCTKMIYFSIQRNVEQERQSTWRSILPPSLWFEERRPAFGVLSIWTNSVKRIVI